MNKNYGKLHRYGILPYGKYKSMSRTTKFHYQFIKLSNDKTFCYLKALQAEKEANKILEKG